MNRFRLSSSCGPGFARRFLAVWGVGLVGVAALLLQPPPPALLEAQPALRELPAVALRLLLLVNPLVLLTALAAIGAVCAPRVGFRSVLAGDALARLDVLVGLAGGAVLALVITLLDGALAPSLGAAWQQLMAQADAAPWLPALLMGALYGGMTEEVVMRWGLMGLVAWSVMALQRRAGGGAGRASALAAWTGIVVAAAVFAAGHLPALAQSVELSGPVVARTLGLNLLAGIAYGWLFWRRSLETAMLAHATTHLGFALARWVG